MKKFILSIALLLTGVVVADCADMENGLVGIDTQVNLPPVDETIGLDLSTDEDGDDVIVEESDVSTNNVANTAMNTDEKPMTAPEAVTAGPADEKNIKDSVVIK